ncbi:ATP-binding protein [Chitinophaga pollutisoli]|uniref:histidine kinase n=1 Tax=Chitinophaga pollutisoli TaxID=3133966 RepID=A0ABZ2YNB4_9BACT
MAATGLPEFLMGGGEMGARIREYNWADSPLGPVETWPQSLRTCVRIMLTSRQPIWIGWGKEFIKLYNDPYKAIAGGKHPRALGQPASAVWSDIWDVVGPMLLKLIENDEGTYVESQLLIMERNGYPEETYYTFSYTPIPGDDGRTAGLICANTDDTERIISDRQLKTLTHLGQRLADVQHNDEVIRKTMATLQANPHDFPFAFFYLYEGGKAVMQSPPETAALPIEIDPEEDHPLALHFKAAMEQRRLQVIDGHPGVFSGLPKGAWTIGTDTAIVLPLLQSAAPEPYGFIVVGKNPYRLANEKYLGFFNMIADKISTSFAHVHALEQERKRAAALAEIDSAKTIFFSNISHEFRTPLTLLLAPLEETLNDPQTPAPIRSRMDLAFRNVLRMQKLVNTLLEFSRIEAGRLEGKFTRVDIGALTANLASVFRSAIEKAGMQLEIRQQKIDAEVYVDVDLWEKIVLNLVSNAVKYSHRGSIVLDIRSENGQVLVSVSDNGIGIAEDQQEKIFERFHRIENTGGRSMEGTGIGLAMVKELVKLHHGSIRVESRPGEGSVFTIALPAGSAHLSADRIVASETAPAVTQNAAAFVAEAMKWLPGTEAPVSSEHDILPEMPSPRDARHRVLLADDNADMREYLTRLLSRQFVVETAIDGEDALQQAINRPPDLLLTDIMMPKLDGMELLKKLRHHPKTSDVPVIFLSARAGEEAKIEGLATGADDYLIKPFSAKEVVAKVEAHIKNALYRKQSARLLNGFLMQAPAAIAVLHGPEHIYTLANARFLALAGKPEAEILGHSIRHIWPAIEGQEILSLLGRVYTSGEPFTANEMPTTSSRENGVSTTGYFDYILHPIKNDEGQVTDVMVYAHEVTDKVQARKTIAESEQHLRQLADERKRFAEKLETTVVKRTRELQRSNEDLLHFAHVASHDLKEPVRKIKTFGKRLWDEYAGAVPEKGQTYVRKVLTAADRMLLVIEGILRYSAISASEQAFSPVDLNELITHIQSDLELPIQQKGAVIRCERLPEIDGAAILLHQLFYNIIQNALKFSRPDHAPVITITCSEQTIGDTAHARISVSDNGIGFDEQYAARIFETFARLHSADRFEGTGLGLALCKKIAERHGGTIAAASRDHEGAEFMITLPVHHTKEA